MALRTRDGEMDVATDIYTDGTRFIAVAGVCHIADASFWDCLNRRIAGYEGMGYSVQYEKIRNDLTDAEKSKFKGSEGTGELYAKLAELAGLQDQSSAITYLDHWENTDITMSEWLKMGSRTRDLMAMLGEAAAGLDKLIAAGGAERLGRDVRFGLRWMPVAQHLIPKNKELNSLILDHRNVVAAEAMLKADGNVVSIWGASHLTGIGKLLRKGGFRRESRVWSTAIHKLAGAA